MKFIKLKLKACGKFIKNSENNINIKMAASTSRKPDQDLSNVEFETSEDVEVVPTFQSMKLREELLRGIYAYGKK